MARWLDRPRELSLRRELAGWRYRPVARDRYQARLRAIEAFSKFEDFDLYGEGWQERHPAVEPSLHDAAEHAYRGPVDDKLAVLAEPAIQKQMIELGGEPVIGTPEAFGALIVSETEKWKTVIEGAGIQKVE